MMQKLMISAALALLVSPALAQDRHHGGGPDGQPQQQPAPQAAPGGNYGPGKAGFGRASAAMHGAPQPAPGAPQAGAPAPQPQPQQGGNRGNWSRDRSDNNNWQGRDDRRWDNDRRGGNDRRGNDNWRGNNGWQGNPGYNRRPDYSNFSRYHQNFRADRRFHAGSYRRPPGWYYRRWSFGQILPSLFWAQQYWLNDYMAYDLPPPPPGTVWVRYGNDALLIDRFTGEIITVQYDVFY